MEREAKITLRINKIRERRTNILVEDLSHNGLQCNLLDGEERILILKKASEFNRRADGSKNSIALSEKNEILAEIWRYFEETDQDVVVSSTDFGTSPFLCIKRKHLLDFFNVLFLGFNRSIRLFEPLTGKTISIEHDKFTSTCQIEFDLWGLSDNFRDIEIY